MQHSPTNDKIKLSHLILDGHQSSVCHYVLAMPGQWEFGSYMNSRIYILTIDTNVLTGYFY